MKNKLLKLFQKKIVKNIMVVASGAATAQIITFLLIPVITRIYGPEAFGLMGSFQAIIIVLMPVAALTLPIAIVLPTKRAEAISIINTSLKIIFLVTILTLAILLLFNNQIVEILQAHEIESFFYLIPIAICMAGCSQIMRQWLIRNKKFKLIAKATIYQPVISHGGMIVVGLYYPTASVLVFFTAIKSGLIAVIMYYNTRRINDSSNFRFNESSLSFKQVIKKYIDFPKYRSPQVLLNAVAQNFPVLLLASLFGPASAGFFTLGRTAMSIPVQLIGKSIGDVFYPRFTEAYNKKEDFLKLLIIATNSLFWVGLLPFGVIFLYGPSIFSLVFGSDWYVAGEYSRWLAVWLLFGLANRPSVQALPVLAAQKFHLNFTIISTVIRICALFIGFYLFSSDIIAIALFSLVGGILNIVLILITIAKCKTHIQP
ncbi:lipopolysaccharide biosynthesis protein [Halobacillus sp. K22]|uniref:lipopolysaccharide biosynthesis protein n=1 Tax=Halobacillus sp. K22 TaxID=3457431 RepID=UPI003FCE659B